MSIDPIALAAYGEEALQRRMRENGTPGSSPSTKGQDAMMQAFADMIIRALALEGRKLDAELAHLAGSSSWLLGRTG